MYRTFECYVSFSMMIIIVGLCADCERGRIFACGELLLPNTGHKRSALTLIFFLKMKVVFHEVDWFYNMGVQVNTLLFSKSILSFIRSWFVALLLQALWYAPHCKSHTRSPSYLLNCKRTVHLPALWLCAHFLPALVTALIAAKKLSTAKGAPVSALTI